MISVAQRWRRFLTHVVLLTFVVTFVGVAAHQHADHPASTTACATCVAAHHSPCAIAAPSAYAIPAATFVAVQAPADAPLVSADRAVHAGRAPPASHPVTHV